MMKLSVILLVIGVNTLFVSGCDLCIFFIKDRFNFYLFTEPTLVLYMQ